ncbi:poly-beta-1,6-N-acetyl-D-glucosamine biosynthesis protein PgaD [Pollutimonas sp. M17]|uniref:poly-beta-1,6-N-acetyl-D-glucosamine biosynthesis protein PgaD n=1 Tax=Pollutimonas sp. M17 TaxID=2962065 RepID=UPI0021F4588C|nr:poly-beta-1,6-N-acetyl-D-glucosamine biosynthesis protein PgaD [Pollutimonas sp. M17]UYO92213.1 poly-beta-1,6-N-acetyl-D-glucosamine biosynthesis protein PgaD [Pollutimonas sp. M17]HWK70192.1 poly-beta-1,6-N-acetyl-D-glucosamine biosynthesis protein PgaD [Burkholderiaceae bacterium]
MIITTQRSPLALAIDTALTALGWIGFFYLFTKGVIAVMDGNHHGPSVPYMEQLWPTARSLTVYALVAAFNAVLVVLWGRYRKLFFRTLNRREAAAKIDDETVATHFHLSSNQLHEIQDSRVTVIYHSNEGDIAHLETDQLRMQPAGNSAVYDAVRAA